jgi:hypothetical protein
VYTKENNKKNMNKTGNPIFPKSRWYSGKTSAVRFPECFTSILTYVAEKLDNQLISELDLQRMIDDYIDKSIKGLSNDKKFETKKNVDDSYKSITIDDFIDSLNDRQKLEVIRKLIK